MQPTLTAGGSRISPVNSARASPPSSGRTSPLASSGRMSFMAANGRRSPQPDAESPQPIERTGRAVTAAELAEICAKHVPGAVVAGAEGRTMQELGMTSVALLAVKADVEEVICADVPTSLMLECTQSPLSEIAARLNALHGLSPARQLLRTQSAKALSRKSSIRDSLRTVTVERGGSQTAIERGAGASAERVSPDRSPPITRQRSSPLVEEGSGSTSPKKRGFKRLLSKKMSRADSQEMD